MLCSFFARKERKDPTNLSLRSLNLTNKKTKSAFSLCLKPTSIKFSLICFALSVSTINDLLNQQEGDYITPGIILVLVAKQKAILPNMTIVVTNILVMVLMMVPANAWDTNPVFDPCSDTKIQKQDGFTFGLAFSTKESFLFNQTQLSPCDQRLSLSGNNAQLAVFRPKVDEISLLTINSTTFNPTMAGGYMVAFAGRQYAARSVPVFVADSTHTITSFTLVLEFQKGTLQNLYWKKFGCDSCSGKSVVCLNNQDCAIPTSQCKAGGGTVDCNFGIQLAFSGTDKNNNVLNSWYEVANFQQYSLFGLYSNLRDTLTGPFNNLL